MGLYWKVIGAVLTVLILGLNIGKQETDMAALLTMAVCCLGALTALTFLEPVLEMLRELGDTIRQQEDLLNVLLKCTGIALVTELASMICQDAGSGAMGRMLQMLGNAVILSLSVPAVTALLNLLREILGVL